jgi:hypothetical protein
MTKHIELKRFDQGDSAGDEYAGVDTCGVPLEHRHGQQHDGCQRRVDLVREQPALEQWFARNRTHGGRRSGAEPGRAVRNVRSAKCG